jgi:phosphate transport system permease protein
VSSDSEPAGSGEPGVREAVLGTPRHGRDSPLPSDGNDQSNLRFRRRLDSWAEIAIFGISLAAISLIFLIFIYITREAWPLIVGAAREASLGGVLGMPFEWQPVSTSPRFSVMPLLVGTIKVTLVAMIFATPLALASAVYAAEFASPRVREWLKPTIELLAGIPSVVVGFFVLIVLASWLQDTLGLPFRLNAMTAGIGLSLAVIPIIFTVAEDALSAVPRTYKEASLALGASRVETAVRVVLPAASPGIGAAMILGFGRAIGETMIVLMVSGNAALIAFDPLTPARTMSATIAAELGEVVFGGDHYRVLFFIGVLLFLITSGLNWAGDRVNRSLRNRLFGGA